MDIKAAQDLIRDFTAQLTEDLAKQNKMQFTILSNSITLTGSPSGDWIEHAEVIKTINETAEHYLSLLKEDGFLLY